MSFKMIYDTRNRTNLNQLADNTRIKAYKLYQYCIDNKIQILIYETIRSKEKQAENVRKGVSKTMKSYHIVGQALDFVFVDGKGSALWSISSYVSKMNVIKYAKSLGFTWGGDWDNDGDWRDETFLDSPHLQYEYKGYGTDTFGKIKDNGDELTVSQYNEIKNIINTQDKKIKELEAALNKKLDKPNPSDAPHTVHSEDWDWLKDETKLSDGTNPTGYLTRQQASTLFHKFYKKFIK